VRSRRQRRGRPWLGETSSEVSSAVQSHAEKGVQLAKTSLVRTVRFLPGGPLDDEAMDWLFMMCWRKRMEVECRSQVEVMDVAKQLSFGGRAWLRGTIPTFSSSLLYYWTHGNMETWMHVLV
jgi:hypothetical protein